MLNAQPVVHANIGTEVKDDNGLIFMSLRDKRQGYLANVNTYEPDIRSPKSVNIHPNGTKYYVNSLEGCATVVFELGTNKKIKVIRHSFGNKHQCLWSKPSQFYNFKHYHDNVNTFDGKPVEGCFSHNGRFFWVPYYRRSFDINAQDPSALAVIDTKTDEIIKLMETGPLPKMIAASPDGRFVAVTHWGDNTIGIINVQSNNPDDWHHQDMIVVDKQLQLNYPLNVAVNRDNGSGYCLRGTVFTPDGKYLFVSCMGGGGGIAAIDVDSMKYLGRVSGMMPNVRHLVIKNGFLYLSVNATGYVQRIKLEKIVGVVKNMMAKQARVDGWETCKVGNGARTIELSPAGNYVFAACNIASSVCVVDARTMKTVVEISCDSYPVGLDISKDGTTVVVTSQGRTGGGGNAVSIYNVKYTEPEIIDEQDEQVVDAEENNAEFDAECKVDENNDKDECHDDNSEEQSREWNVENLDDSKLLLIALGGIVCLISAAFVISRMNGKKKRRRNTFVLFLLLGFSAYVYAQNPQVVHSTIGDAVMANDSSLIIKLIDKRQNFENNPITRERDINSPKSANIHPNGKKYYINSLEGCATVVFEMGTNKKLKTIRYHFNDKDANLWSTPSELYPFKHYKKNLNTFDAKPVEGCFSHGGRYFWVPFYRRTYDINAQDPSAIAVIDTQNDEIVKLMETGPLPKMVATSHDGSYLAIAHWGNNTVGIVDIKGEKPEEWKHTELMVVDYVLPLNFSLTKQVNRDSDSGYCLRGTVFTPDDKYLLVACMGGGYGIAVFDMQNKKYLGRILGMRNNVRHLVIKNGYLYLSINKDGYVQRIKLDQFINAAENMDNQVAVLNGWEECQVGEGARTIELSPDGKFVFAACNIASQISIVNTNDMKVVANIKCDSFPVGLDISKDGNTVITTSQGRNNGGGNAVNIFSVEYLK